MKILKIFSFVVFASLILVCLQTVSVRAQKLGNISSRGSSVRWEIPAPNAGVTLTISAPDGEVYRKEFPAGSSPEFVLSDQDGNRLSDGIYTYELRLAPVLGAGVKEELAKARKKGDDAKVARDLRKRGLLPTGMVESGSFSIQNGAAVVAGSSDEPSNNRKSSGLVRPSPPPSGNTETRLRQHRLALRAIPDQVIPDDLIVQGSICAGLDCVNNENFGFDTIRLKENNTRLQFDDTSTSAGFATNNWQIRANSSASGGGSFLAFVDQGGTGNSETGTIVFEVDAGAPANSLRVSSVGNVGVGTANPVLDVSVNTTDTPAIRLEQNNSGGFTAQTWDIGANEANFFVRDVTSGSRLPLRIRPGAATSSIDISADGNVGIGTASPVVRLHSQIASANTAQPAGAADIGLFIGNSDTTANNLSVLSLGNAANAGQGQIGVINLGSTSTAGGHMFFTTRAAGGGVAERMRITSAGNVGIGTTAPDQKLSVNGDASKTGGNTWLAFSDERLKTIKGRFNTGLKAVMQLQPIRYEYLKNNALGLKSEGEHIGFGAQTLQKVIPEAVTKNADGYLMVNSDPIIWTMLNAIKEQQKEIAELKAEVQKLRAASHRRRK